jgi:hypothetical protein
MEKWPLPVRLLKQYEDDPSSDEDTPPLFTGAQWAGSIPQPMRLEQFPAAATGCVAPGSSTDWLNPTAYEARATMADDTDLSKGIQTDSSQDCGEGDPSSWLWLQGNDPFQTDLEVNSIVISWAAPRADVKDYCRSYEEQFG